MSTMHDEDAAEAAEAQAEYDRSVAAAKQLEDAKAEARSKPDALTLSDQVNLRMIDILEKLSDRNEAGPTPQIPFAQAKFCTPWNPSGKPYRDTLQRKTFVNDFQIREITHSEEEIRLLNQVRPGRYNNRKWLVREEDSGEVGHSIHLYFPNRTQAQRIELTAEHKGRGLVGLLERIVAEQNAVTAASA